MVDTHGNKNQCEWLSFIEQQFCYALQILATSVPMVITVCNKPDPVVQVRFMWKNTYVVQYVRVKDLWTNNILYEEC